MKYTLVDIARIVGGTVSGIGDIVIEHLETDSRRIGFPKSTLFFAVSGTHHDGHRFIDDCHAMGIRAFVIEVDVKDTRHDGVGFIRVQSSIVALQLLATHHRNQFNIPIIGITGSNGKTIVKEWVAQLLTPEITIAKSPKSYNSQLGVPLSVWRLNAHHQLGVLEAGISEVGEMEKLEPIIRPTIGVFTNIGSAHSAGFKNQREKIVEKLRLFTRSDVLTFCRDHEAVHDVVSEQLPSTKTLTWSLNGRGDINAEVNKGQGSSRCTITLKGASFELQFPFTDDISIENALHCFAVMVQLGVDLEVHMSRFMQLRNLPLRLELKKAAGGSTLIYDCYNADLDSLALALDFMAQHDATGHRTVILSDLLQSDLNDDELYARVAQLLRQRNISSLVGIGQAITHHAKVFDGMASSFYVATDAFIQKHSPETLSNQTILLKGARTFQFERIGQYLERKVHQTVLEIDLNALAHNLSVYRGLLHEDVKVMVMVKALSYGAGSYEIAQLLQFHQVDYLAVAYTDEGIELRQSGIRLPILVMNPSPTDIPLLLEHKLEPEIYHVGFLERYIGSTIKAGDPPPIHLKLETGMHRLGFSEGELEVALKLVAAQNHVRVASMFTHLAASDDPAHDDFTMQQFVLFERLALGVAKALSYQPLRHVLNSSGIARFPDRQYEMVRLGIGLYGIDTSDTLASNLRPISTLKTVVLQVKEVSAGNSVGYDRAFIAPRQMRIAIIGIGYADGYRRSLGNRRAEVLIRGQRVNTVGNICMDMTMVDVTEIRDCKVGDEVEVFGVHIAVADLAQQAGTSAYEIISTVSSRVKRVYLEE